MPAKRAPMRKIKELLRLKFSGGLSHRQIVAALGVSLGAVSKIVSRTEGEGINWPLIADLDESEIEARLFPKAAPSKRKHVLPDGGLIHRELRRKGSRDLESYARAWLAKGCEQERAFDWDGAIASYNLALAADPVDPLIQYFANNNLGYSLLQLGRFDEAEEYFEAATRINPEQHNAHKNIGLAREGQGRWLDAASVPGGRNPDGTKPSSHHRHSGHRPEPRNANAGDAANSGPMCAESQ